jgi:hypothetical protein
MASKSLHKFFFTCILEVQIQQPHSIAQPLSLTTYKDGGSSTLLIG